MSATEARLADADFARESRLITVDTVLGDDRLLATSLAGAEAISEVFRYEVELLSSDHAIAPERLVGTPVGLRIMPPDTQEVRHIHGMMARFSAGPLIGRGLRSYRAELVPWPWFLSQSSDCRIFQTMNVPDIIERVFKDHGFTDFEMKLERGDYPKRDYCVQYREPALDFVSRLMEEEGIFYFFRHEQKRHVMVLADSNAAFRDLPAPANFPRFTAGAEQGGQINAWERSWRFRPGRWTQRDYDFERPTDQLLASEATVLKFPRVADFERFDYPGRYLDLSRGRQLTRVRIQSEEAAHQAVHGAGSCAGFCPGGKFALAVHPIAGEAERSHVLRRVRHEARDPTYLVGMGGGVARYTNSFECFPADLAFRPDRVTPKPVVQGPQTATVTGPAGEEIHTDKHGRVKLRFHWDRNPDGNADEQSSCWVRVSQSWAGKGFGAILIPRIGQEVVVDFLEGDPDCPLVTGRVYNGDNPVPFGLPGAATQTGFKSNSSKGGGGSNELRMEDSKGSEQVYFHAQKDLDSVVENNETRHVKVNRDTTIDANETVTIGANRTETVMANETIHVVANRTETVDANEVLTVALTRTHTVGIADTLTVGAARTHTVGAAETIAVGATRSVSVGRSQTVQVGTDQSVTVGKDQSLSVGKDHAVTVAKNETHDVGKTLTVTAGDEIVLKTGSASITMKKNGDIVIQGKQITIKGSGDVILKGQKILQN